MYILILLSFDSMYSSIDAVFCENSEPRSLEDKQKRARKTFDEMRNYIPGWAAVDFKITVYVYIPFQ